MKLLDITRRTEEFANSHAYLRNLEREFDLDIAALRANYAKRYRQTLGNAKKKRDKLEAAILASPELFAKPRTLIIAGVKVGLAKGKGGIQYGDPEIVCARIMDLFAEDEARALLHVKVCPNKEALEKLDVRTLRKLGCDSIAAGDVAVIKPQDGEMTVLGKKLLKQIATDQEAE